MKGRTILLPSSDLPVALPKRYNLQSEPDQERRHGLTTLGLVSTFRDALKSVTFGFGIDNWIIGDRLLNGLDESILTATTFLTRLEYPCLPTYLAEAFKKTEFTLKDDHFRTTRLHVRTVFLTLGHDMVVYLTDEIETTTFNLCQFIVSMMCAFDEKIKNRSICRTKPIDDENEIIVQYDASRPRFVVVTVPEIGELERKFRTLNAGLRAVVTDYSDKHGEGLEILDWAVLCQQSGATTYDTRVRLLFEEANVRYGVTVKRDNVTTLKPHFP
jgi:hypothetical protein